MIRYILVLAVAILAGLTTAKADITWVCSILEDGKPQVIKYAVGKNGVTVTDWRDRLGEKYVGPGVGGIRLKVVEDNAQGMVAVGAGSGTEPGQRSNYSSRMLIINKHTGELSDSELSTLTAPVETKGLCTN